jgi:hypothetical protein
VLADDAGGPSTRPHASRHCHRGAFADREVVVFVIPHNARTVSLGHLENRALSSGPGCLLDTLATILLPVGGNRI